MTVVNKHIAHHQHVQAMYEELLKDVKGVTVHRQPTGTLGSGSSADILGSDPSAESETSAFGSDPVYDSNYWLCTITLDPELKVKGQENAYKTIETKAVGGAAGVIHRASTAVTDCQPNENVEAMRIALNEADVEARPVWKPMHKQPCYATAPAYVNGVSEAIFKVGMCLPAGPYVTDDDVRYIVETIKRSIE